MRILLVSQMYPGPTIPISESRRPARARARGRGHELERAVLDRRSAASGASSPLHASAEEGTELSARGRLRRTSSFRPVIGGLGRKGRSWSRRTGQTYATSAGPGLRALTATPSSVASEIIAVSGFLAPRLETKLPQARREDHVMDCGVDLDASGPATRPRLGARSRIGREKRPLFLCVGSLTERRTSVRLARCLRAFGKGSLVFLATGRYAASWRASGP